MNGNSFTVKMTERGQITLPSELRKETGLLEPQSLTVTIIDKNSFTFKKNSESELHSENFIPLFKSVKGSIKKDDLR